MNRDMRTALRLQMDCKPTAIGLQFDCTRAAIRQHFDCTNTAFRLRSDRSAIVDCAWDALLCPVRTLCLPLPTTSRNRYPTQHHWRSRHVARSAAATSGNRLFLKIKILFRRFPPHFCGGDAHIFLLTHAKIDSRETLN